MKADGLLSAKHLLDFRKELGNCIESHCVPIGVTLEVDRLERQMLRLVETFGLIVTERHRNYRKSVQYGSSPEPDIVSNVADKAHRLPLSGYSGIHDECVWSGNDTSGICAISCTASPV